MCPKTVFRLLAIWVILITGLGFGPAGQTLALANAPESPVYIPNPIAAEQNCQGLDIVFLVSQSTMSNLNDTFKLRMDGVRSAIDVLGENALFFCPGITHRISVIGFAQTQGLNSVPVTETYIPIPGKKGSDLIQPNLNALAAWEDRKKNEFAPALPIKDLGTYSHYQSAFEAAAAQFKVWGDQPLDKLPRRRAVIVIGEGGLCTAQLQCGNYQKVIDDLNKVLDPNGSIFPYKEAGNPQNVSIYFIGILARRITGTQFFEDEVTHTFWTNATTSHGGQLLILQRGQGPNLESNLNTDLGLKLGKAMDTLLGDRLRANNCQPFWINPYTADLTILHFFRKNTVGQNGQTPLALTIQGSKGNTVIASYENGQTKTGTGKVISYAAPANEKYVLFQTPPGLYTMEVTGGDYCQDIDLQIGQTGLTVNVLSPEPSASFPQVDQAPYYDQAKPGHFRVQLFQQNLQGAPTPLKELPDYPMAIKAVVRSQAGSQNQVSATYPLYRVDDANAVYESKEPIQTRFSGEYGWILSAETRNPRQFDLTHPNSAPLDVVRKEGVFSVGTTTHSFNFVIQNLNKTQEYALVDGAIPDPLEVVVQVVNPDNSPFRVDQSVTPKGVPAFVATLKRPNGEVITKELTETHKSNFYSAQLPVTADKPSSYEPGCYTIGVKLKDGFDKSVSVPVRTETEPVSVCLTSAKKFTWTIVSPTGGETYRLHPIMGGFSAPEKLPIILQAFDTSNQQIYAADIQTADKPIFTGVVSVPGQSKGIPIVFSADRESGDFLADWPAEADQEGPYVLRVNLNTDNLGNTYFSPVNRLEPVQFTRRDDFLSKPWTLPLIGLGLVLVIVVLIVLTISKALRAGRSRGIQGIHSQQ